MPHSRFRQSFLSNSALIVAAVGFFATPSWPQNPQPRSAPQESVAHIHAGSAMPVTKGILRAQADKTTLPPILPRDREISLAESAGLATFTKQATIYVLERGKGYVIARSGNNGFACLVERERPDSLEPECLDPEGVAAILPRFLDAAALREKGQSPEEISRAISEGFQSGRYRASKRAGISYMLSKENRVFNGTSVIPYPAHIMIYAPYVTNADIGSDNATPGMPWVLEEGTPHAYIMVVTRDDARSAKSSSSQPK